MTLEITIPVLNEERSLEKQILKILAFVQTLDHDNKSYSLVIADNGSSDNTRAIGMRMANEISSIKYIRLPKPGVGLALKTSWGESTADIVGYMDLDLSTDITHLNDVVKKFENMDVQIVNGSRLLKNSQVIGRKLLREITSRGFNFLITILFGIQFTDGMCGFKFLRRDILESIHANGANNDGWFYSTELLIIGEKLGYSICEIPVKWEDDVDSRVKVTKLTLRYLKDMISLRRKLSVII